VKWFVILFCQIASLGAEPITLRIVAANLTSDNRQTYSPDNGNHSNPEGAGARILKALQPDIVLIQEFNTTVPVRQWVNQTLGEDFHIAREEGVQIPNGVISRFPILASGSWNDPVLDNREFLWAKLALTGGRELWTVSVHLHSKNASSRRTQSVALLDFIRRNVPPDALLIIGGDLNTRTSGEACFEILSSHTVVPANPPADADGNTATNSPRNRPYDWILVSKALELHKVPVKIAGREFPHGLVFDTRVFTPIELVPPARKSDSALPMMQHMAVVRDFFIP
jgi:endonuclease/exonuclease/phosphatase family metal-dependent hydrolase